ncbi:MAG: HAMP domain-containing sensor histidine kinase [Chloroflexota bacterium]
MGSRRRSWLRGSTRLGRLARGTQRILPRTFQGRLTIAFVTVLVLTLGLVTVLVLNRLDDYFTQQQSADLDERAKTVSLLVRQTADSITDGRPVVSADGRVDPVVAALLANPAQAGLIADRIGQADVILSFGFTVDDDSGPTFVPAANGTFRMPLQAGPAVGQTREQISRTLYFAGGNVLERYTLSVTLADPYTYRAAAIANVTGLLAAIALVALGLSVIVSAGLARRFTTPLRQLTDASRALAEGDLTRRVPAAHLRSGSSEIAELAVQFNTMADRLEESVEIIRRDRDRSRDFLADVSHELRTPLAALRTFNQLLIESAGDDPEARAEFLESSAGQIERLDWLAQNLLELSKLDSGLVLLDLRPDDLRAAVESATHQHDALAARRGVTLTVDLPDAPVRIRHDPTRIGQVVANLVGNAIKFTPRGGSVHAAVASTDGGARVDVTDTGVGIDPAELPRIFDRFYRGSRANEARSSGSGLGLAIVRSIVDMHGGTIQVESGSGSGTRFTVSLPRDPRTIAGTPAAEQADVASAAEGSERIAAATGSVVETSPSDGSHMNPASAP